eukprot:7880106-Pyramimonas_sp.AAC.1
MDTSGATAGPLALCTRCGSVCGVARGKNCSRARLPGPPFPGSPPSFEARVSDLARGRAIGSLSRGPGGQDGSGRPPAVCAAS